MIVLNHNYFYLFNFPIKISDIIININSLTYFLMLNNIFNNPMLNIIRYCLSEQTG